jgi:hypothetical protein
LFASPCGSGKGSRTPSFSHSLTLSAMIRILLAHLSKDRVCSLYRPRPGGIKRKRREGGEREREERERREREREIRAEEREEEEKRIERKGRGKGGDGGWRRRERKVV